MRQPSAERHRLLHQAVYGFAQRHPEYTIARIEHEIARAVGLSSASVQKWRAGHPIAERHVPTLAEWAVRQAGMDCRWLRSFLRQCDYGSGDLESRLFGPVTSLALSRETVGAGFEELRRRNPLPAPDFVRLFGVESLIERLVALLSDPDGPRFVSIEGLAQAVASRLSQHGDLANFPCWISARHEWITGQGDLRPLNDPAHSVDDVVARLAEQLSQEQLAGLATADKLARLEQLLSTASYLVVVDNLETMTDNQALLPALHPLAGATRFLLTSRHTLQHFPYVHVLPVPELSWTDSYALVQSELDRRGQALSLSREAMDELYGVIGGLPLALKLATAQIGYLPLAQILTGLRQADRRAPETMYTYIYRRTWCLLDDPARKLLLSMLNVSPDGDDVHWLRLASMLPEAEFDAALAQLLDYSLLETIKSLPDPIYRLHRLTVTFLQTEILLHWHSEEVET
jgi:hypothetical protein